MPIYGFVCNKCGKRFDKIFSSPEILSVNCSACDSQDVEKVSHSGSLHNNRGSAPVPAGALSGGSCKSGFS
jgi:putative FmdB family regulatory protein